MIIDDKSLDVLISPTFAEDMTPEQRAEAGVLRRNLYIVANSCAAVVRERHLPCLLRLVLLRCYCLFAATSMLIMVATVVVCQVCCRARPSQKAALVQLIRDGSPTVRTLAIGDGANDVDMIQTAHVGVGIAGAEGVQAANASDFSIGRFRFLQRLLLVHGRWNYRRMSKLVCYMFYKNIALVLAQFLYVRAHVNAWSSVGVVGPRELFAHPSWPCLLSRYTILTGWSGQKFYVEPASQTFNLVYTGPPILILGLLDQDVSADDAQRFPLLYSDGPNGKRFNFKVFWGWVLQAVFEAAVCLVVCSITMETMDPDGASPYVFELGNWVFTAVILVTSLRVCLETHAHNLWFQVRSVCFPRRLHRVTARWCELRCIGALMVAVVCNVLQVWVFLSVIAWVPFMYFFDVLDFDGMQGGTSRMFGSWVFWVRWDKCCGWF